MGEVGQHHGQMRAPVAPLLLSTGLQITRSESEPLRQRHREEEIIRQLYKSFSPRRREGGVRHTMAEAGILPDISW